MIPSNIKPKPWSRRASLMPRRTYSAESSIVYKRSKHRMTMADVDRISKKFTSEDAPPDKLPIFLEVINRLASLMLDRIMGVIGLDDDLGRVLWDWVMSQWAKVTYALTQDSQAVAWGEEYMRRYRRALRAYLAGDRRLMDRILKDLAGG